MKIFLFWMQKHTCEWFHLQDFSFISSFLSLPFPVIACMFLRSLLPVRLTPSQGKEGVLVKAHHSLPTPPNPIIFPFAFVSSLERFTCFFFSLSLELWILLQLLKPCSALHSFVLTPYPLSRHSCSCTRAARQSVHAVGESTRLTLTLPSVNIDCRHFMSDGYLRLLKSVSFMKWVRVE